MATGSQPRWVEDPILGIGGQVARHVIDLMAGQDATWLTLFLRNVRKLHRAACGAVRVVTGDGLDKAVLGEAMQGQDLVYANLAGDGIDRQTKAVVAAMKSADVQRLIFIASLGIYVEPVGEFQQWSKAMIGEELKPFRRAADVVEAPGLDYTLLRPAWLTDEDEVGYEATAKGETFNGTEVSRRSVAYLVAKAIVRLTLHVRANLEVGNPGSNGDKPSFY